MEEFKKTTEELDGQIKAVQEQVDVSLANITNLGGKDSTQAGVDTKAANERREALKAEFEKAYQLRRYYLEKETELHAKNAPDEKSSLDFRLESVQKGLEAQEQLAETTRQYVLSKEKITASERVLINRRADDAISEARAAATQKKDEIRKQDAEREKQFIEGLQEQAKGEYEKQIEDYVAGQEIALNKRLQTIERGAFEELKVQQELYEAGKITKEQYEAEKLRIENQAQERSIQAQIDYYRKLLELIELTPEQKRNAEERPAEFELRLDQLKLQRKKEVADKEVELEKEKRERIKQLAKEKRERIKQLAGELQETVFSFIDSGYERQRNAISDQITKLEEKKQKDIEVANQTIVSTDEREKAIKAIETRASIEKLQLEESSAGSKSRKRSSSGLRILPPSFRTPPPPLLLRSPTFPFRSWWVLLVPLSWCGH